MRRLCVSLGLLVVVTLLFPGVARAGGGFALVVGRGFLGDRETERVVIIVRDGKIVSVAEGHAPTPADLPVVEYPDGYVTPGLVAAASNLTGPHRSNRSLSAGFRAVDAFDRYGDYRLLLAAGITTVHLGAGEHRLITGQGAVAKLAGPPEQRVLVDAADLALQLGDPADGPPLLVEFPFPPSSDVAMEPSKRQRPRSRLARVLGLREEIRRALDGEREFDFHADALARAWRDQRPLRIAADRAVDILAALSFLAAEKRQGYIIGGAELQKVVDALRDSPVPVIYRPAVSLRAGATNLGVGRDVVEAGVADFSWSHGQPDFPIGIGPPRGGAMEDLRLGAVLAHREGLARVPALAAICEVPATALGVADRIGRITNGRDADLVVWNADPLSVSAQPVDVFVNGRRAWRPEVSATVISAGTIWVSPERTVRDGEILLEDGKIVAVGSSVPHPPHARRVDAGASGFVAPGFIDARGHLGLEGDQGAVGTGVRLGKIIGVPDLTEQRVAAAGITTVLVSPYRISASGSPSAAVKTWGRSRDDRIVRDVAAVLFEVSGDPRTVKDRIRRTLDRGKKYLARWQKYEKELEEWQKKIDAGEKVDVKESDEEVEEVLVDPVTGVWQGTASGVPLPEPQTGKVSLELSGNQVEGRVIEPPVPVDHRIVMTLEGNHLSGIIEVDMDLPDTPRIEADLDGDTMTGKITVLAFTIDFEATRISKEAVEYKVSRRRKSHKDGKPVAPTLDPALEPLRQLLEGKIPAVVRVNGVERIGPILDLFLDEEKLPVVLLEADGARLHAARLAEKKVGIVVPVVPLGRVRGRVFHPSDHYSRQGIPIAFQSVAEDGARDLPLRALFSVERGLAADDALEALTSAPARMYKLEDRIGTLEPGHDADVLLFRGHPFRDGGRLERVWINGEEVDR